MIKNKGFSFIELLVAILIVSGLSIVLLKQQLFIRLMSRNTLLQNHNQIEKDNLFEHQLLNAVGFEP